MFNQNLPQYQVQQNGGLQPESQSLQNFQVPSNPFKKPNENILIQSQYPQNSRAAYPLSSSIVTQLDIVQPPAQMPMQ